MSTKMGVGRSTDRGWAARCWRARPVARWARRARQDALRRLRLWNQKSDGIAASSGAITMPPFYERLSRPIASRLFLVTTTSPLRSPLFADLRPVKEVSALSEGTISAFSD